MILLSSAFLSTASAQCDEHVITVVAWDDDTLVLPILHPNPGRVSMMYSDDARVEYARLDLRFSSCEKPQAPTVCE